MHADNENDGAVVGHYSTRGGRYQIMVYEKNGGYSYRTFKGLNPDGAGIGYKNRAEVAGAMARMIYFAARIDGINYRAVMEMPEVTALLAPAPQEV